MGREKGMGEDRKEREGERKRLTIYHNMTVRGSHHSAKGQ
jgi:hypothetical protein